MSERTEFLEQLLSVEDEAGLREYVERLHASDLADLLEDLGQEQRLRLLSLMPAEAASEALAEMEEVEHPGELLSLLEPARIRDLLGELANDDAADLLGELEPEEQARLLASADDAGEIQELLHYPEDTAGGIMTQELMAVSSRLTAGGALDQIRRQATDLDDFFTIFVIDPDRKLRGIVGLQTLVLADPDRPILELTEDPPAVVTVEMDQEDVGRILSRYNLVSIGVVDPLSRLVGRVTFDDVIDVIEAETTEDILRFAAVSEEEEVRGGVADAIRSRLPWLVLNLATVFVAASVVWFYEDAIAQMAVLAVAMPIIAGMGGNAGTQALAVTVRRIALSDETLSERWGVVGKELVVGVLNGAVIGSIIAVVGLIAGEGLLFGLVVMAAMWANLAVAGFAGSFIPIFLESMGVDPAVASSIFITTLTDLCGFLLLLGLASYMLL
ncbi:MAG: magnesium transporter [Gemmatimonadota bacterium]